MKLVVKNIFSNYIGKIWSFISIYLFVPLYIKFLGIESYGIINFYTILLSIMIIADAGLSASLNREISKGDDINYQRNLVKTIEIVYLGICISVIGITFLFSKIIATRWLVSSGEISVDQVVICVKLMGATIALQMLFVLYNSGLMGLQKQVLSNNIQIAMSLFRSGIVLLPVYFIPKIEVYFIWQVVVTFVFTILIRAELWNNIPSNVIAFFDKKILKSIYRFALGMMLMALISGVNSQIDKLFVSKLLSLSDFGYYSLAGTFGQIPTILVMPITMAILPKMTKSVSNNEIDKQREIFHTYSFFVSAIVSILACALLLFSPTYLMFWLKNMTTVLKIEEVCRILFIGGVFLALQFMPYYLAISNGHTKTNVKLGLLTIIIIIPMLYISINTYGIIGAAYPWLALNLFAFIYLGYFIITRFLKGEFLRWLFVDTCIPLSIALVTYLFVNYFVSQQQPTIIEAIIYSISISISLAISYYIVFNKVYKVKN